MSRGVGEENHVPTKSEKRKKNMKEIEIQKLLARLKKEGRNYIFHMIGFCLCCVSFIYALHEDYNYIYIILFLTMVTLCNYQLSQNAKVQAEILERLLKSEKEVHNG